MAKAAKQATEVKSVDELQAQLETKRTDLLAAKRGLAAGELANPRTITATRKEIARLLTAIRAAEIDEKESK
jgi:ribosomal protein L29